MRRAGRKPRAPELEPLGTPDRLLFLRGIHLVCGVDEAGRGPLAGPVVAAAVVLPPQGLDALPGLGDSKTLARTERETLVPRIREIALAIAIGVASHDEIDHLNILRASLLAMARAIEALPVTPEYLLVDGDRPVPVGIPQEALVRGDARSACIAAASNIAKEHRDALMRECAVLYPGYGFAEHMGYPTPAHRRALASLGPSPIHRRTFRGVRELLGARLQSELFLGEARH